MRLPRRESLKTGIISAVSAGIALTGARTTIAQKQTRGQVSTTIERRVHLPFEVQSDPVFSFKPETFKSYIGDIFTAPNANGENIELELLSVKIFKPVNSGRFARKVVTESFSLTFKAEAGLPPFTSIHKIHHPALGQFQLFLVKRRSNNGDLFYDAIINHLL